MTNSVGAYETLGKTGVTQKTIEEIEMSLPGKSVVRLPRYRTWRPYDTPGRAITAEEC